MNIYVWVGTQVGQWAQNRINTRNSEKERKEREKGQAKLGIRIRTLASRELVPGHQLNGVAVNKDACPFTERTE